MQALLADPEKMKAATEKYNAILKAQQEAQSANSTEPNGGKVEKAGAGGSTAEGAGDAAKAEAGDGEALKGKPEATPEGAAAQLDELKLGDEGGSTEGADPEATGVDAAEETRTEEQVTAVRCARLS